MYKGGGAPDRRRAEFEVAEVPEGALIFQCRLTKISDQHADSPLKTRLALSVSMPTRFKIHGWPLPRPSTMIRPSVSRSAAAISLAKTTGWWMGTLRTPVRKRICATVALRQRRVPKEKGSRKLHPSRSFRCREEVISPTHRQGRSVPNFAVDLPF
jgi:hypothetical protein